MIKEYTERLSNIIIGCAIEVHRHLGPGLQESAYHQCLSYEFSRNNIPFLSEQQVPVTYKEIKIDCTFRADFMVDNCIIVELKAVETILPVHEAQILTYLKLTGIQLGLLINFNERLLKQGIKRFIL
jgi:GxxExxY protein